jgi:opacity protein-like surface antigen
MMKFPVIVLVVLSVVFAGVCEAAPKKRTRNQNRIGPYGSALVGQTSYTEDQSANEQTLLEILEDNGIPLENMELGTEDSDIGYQLAFGYRFHRFFAAEIALVQYGELSSLARGELDSEPSSAELTFNVAGPVFSGIGILPMGEHFEAYARVGYLFASVEREFVLRIDGQNAGSLTAKGDSQNLVYGAGLAWNVNQVYSVRAEYQKLEDVGQSGRTGTEDLESLSIGLLMRF